MGCSGSQTLSNQDKSSHKLPYGKGFTRNAQVDCTSNPNKIISSLETYYKNQKPPSYAFSDDRFPPNSDTVFGKFNGEYTDTNEERRNKALRAITLSPEEIEWKHANEIWGDEAKIFGDKISLDDIKIGQVANAYFVATLSALAEFPFLILQLFKTVEIPDNGQAIEIAMQIDGEWKIVPVDDLFPINKNNGKPIFSDAPNKNLWGVFLEKAWAKVNGGYANIVIGYPRDVFEAFTPFTTIPIEVSRENKDSLWNNIKGADLYDCIMTCSIRKGTPNLSNVGLIDNHSFTLVSAFERKVGNDNVKLMKIRNPFGEGEWNGDWSDGNSKWTSEAKKAFPEYDAKGKNDGIFWIDFNNFCKYFQYLSICIPLKPIKSTGIKIDKDKADKFNVIKINVEGDGILSVTLNKKYYRFHRKIQPEEDVLTNLILAKCNEDNIEYLDSAYNETMSTYVKEGEYLCLFNADYKTINVTPRKYTVTISSNVDFQICQLDPDDDNHNLLKSIMIPKIESLPKYSSRFQNRIALFTGNRFQQCAISFLYIKNLTDDVIHFKPNIYFKNIKSIDGELPKGLKMKKDDIFLFLGNRIKVGVAFQSGGNGKFSDNSIPGEIEPNINFDIVKKYLNAHDYEDIHINFECN
jgi:hypothetical protein